MTALHQDAMREAIAADGEAHRALLAGEDARPALRRAAERYRASWEAAPPGSYGRLVGYAKASILAGENPLAYVRDQLGAEDRTPPACWARALAYLADGNDDRAVRAAEGMYKGSEAFGRAADAITALARADRDAYVAALGAIVADFEAREEHLTGVPIADTALVLDRLAEARRLAAHPESPLLPHVDDVRAILTGTRVWAVVGCSPDPGRDSHRIASMLQRRGYTVIPVNPLATEILGERCYPTLAAVPQPVEVVDIFRRASAAGAHVDEAVQVGARAVWMQLGVIDAAAAERGRAAGLRVVMDRCPAIELPKLGL
ncbi:MAG TPA: CoA-binding protein [Solirubrobacteraceae bacterium]|nr:CoA-binding protein [Solirubrobacteraceae bacterium]